jgi:hypothetical protein
LDGPPLKLFNTGYNLDCRNYAFSHRILDVCSIADEDTIAFAFACYSFSSFKIRKFLHDRGLM